jgi:YfiH family protein
MGQNPKADGLVTTRPDIALGALAADCAPVLFADPEARVIGAAHAGWKGALGGVLEATIATMARLGARPSRIRAALGPCIGPGAYEVGPEFEERFLSANPGYARFFRRPRAEGRPHFDLPAFVLERLARAGLDTVENCTACTYSDDSRLFSYRRATHRGEPDYGRQVSAIVLL